MDNNLDKDVLEKLKNNLRTLFNEDLRMMSIGTRASYIDYIQEEIIPQLKDELTKETTYCPHCHDYYLSSQWEKSLKMETFEETTFIDAGYGDDDMIGDVTYLMEYSECPMCKKSIRTKKEYLYTQNERRRKP